MDPYADLPPDSKATELSEGRSAQNVRVVAAADDDKTCTAEKKKRKRDTASEIDVDDVEHILEVGLPLSTG